MVDNKYLLIECFLVDEYFEYLSENDEFMYSKIKSIVEDRDIYINFHCSSEMKMDRLANGFMYDSSLHSSFVRVSYNKDLSIDDKKEIASEIRASLVFADYPFKENKEGFMEKNYDVDDVNCFLSVKYVQFMKINDDDLICFDSKQAVELESEDDWN